MTVNNDTDTIKVIVADDHPVMRLGLKHLIEGQGDMNVLGETGEAQQALQLIEKHCPDVLILDVEMPDMNGIELAQLLQVQKPLLNIIIFTGHHDEETFNRAITAGVKGYISKENVFADLVDGIRTVAQGRNYFSAAFSDFLLRRIRNGGQLRPKDSPDRLLTTAERRIIKLIAESKSSTEIAEELFVSVKTVENHRSNICKKLRLQGKNSLLKFAIDNKTLWNGDN